MSDGKYPEHDKLRAAKTEDATQAVGEFLEWLQDVKHIQLAEHVCVDRLAVPHDPWHECGEGCEMSNHLYPAAVSHHRLMHEFFGLDPDKLEREKSEMLEALRSS